VERSHLSTADVAARWDVSTDTVRRLIRRGDLAALKVGRNVRIRLADLIEYEQRAELVSA